MNKSENQLLKASTMLFVLNITASALNYLCQLSMARVLSVEAYGMVNAIFSFMLLVGVPGTTLTMVTAKKIAGELAGNLSQVRGYIKRQVTLVFLLTFVIFLGLCAFTRSVSGFLRISNGWVLLFALMLSALGFFQPLYSGIFSGAKCFVFVGIYSMMIPVYKFVALGLAILATADDLKRIYVLLGVMVIGTVGTALLGHLKTIQITGRFQKDDIYNGGLFTSSDFHALLLNLSLMLYMNIDLLSVRYRGSETESGWYSSALLFGRILYYFSTTLGTIILPSVASRDLSGEGQNKTLRKALMVMIGFSIFLMVPLYIWRKEIIALLYGSEYVAAAKYVSYVGLISSALGIYTVIVNYAVGIGKTKTVTAIMIVMDLLLVLNSGLFNDLNIILRNIGLLGVLGALLIYIYLYCNYKKKDR